jgi:hypothetical protein
LQSCETICSREAILFSELSNAEGRVVTMSNQEDHTEPEPLSEEGIHVQLTHSLLDVSALIKLVKSPEAGAIVTFIGESYRFFNIHTGLIIIQELLATTFSLALLFISHTHHMLR